VQDDELKPDVSVGKCTGVPSSADKVDFVCRGPNLSNILQAIMQTRLPTAARS